MQIDMLTQHVNILLDHAWLNTTKLKEEDSGGS